MLRTLVAAFVALVVASLSGCKTTTGSSEYFKTHAHKPGVNHPSPSRDPGYAERVRNAFGNFMY